MMCYEDKTWCPYGKECINSKDCSRNFTEEDKIKAIEWWGDEHFPISFYSNLPKCFNNGEICDHNDQKQS